MIIENKYMSWSHFDMPPHLYLFLGRLMKKYRSFMSPSSFIAHARPTLFNQLRACLLGKETSNKK